MVDYVMIYIKMNQIDEKYFTFTPKKGWNKSKFIKAGGARR